ncbi:hypothetical protein LLB_3491 [Legionella longbeachae D-4968]|nr:hypothetical protein LLB_3491 [Legionella longbeachae D-4968]
MLFWITTGPFPVYFGISDLCLNYLGHILYNGSFYPVQLQ